MDARDFRRGRPARGGAAGAAMRRRLARLLAVGMALALALGAAPAAARWWRAETPNFAIYGSSDRAVRAAAEQLEGFDALLRQLTGVGPGPLPVRLQVYLVPDAAGLRAVGVDAPTAAGVYFARPRTIAAVVAQAEGARAGSATAVLFHEYAHHFMYQYGPGGYPPWYTEGFAEYVMTARIGGDRVEWGLHDPGRVAALQRGPWLPMAAMLTADGAAVSGGKLPMFYPQAWLMVHYMNREAAPRAGLARYMAALRRGEAPVAAFTPAFGMSPEAFAQLLRAYFTGGTMTYNRAPWSFSAVPVRVEELPASAARLLLPRLYLAQGVRPGGEAALLAQIRAEAAKWPGDPQAALALAEAETWLGDPGAALALLAALPPGAAPASETALLTGAARRAEALAGAPALRGERMARARADLSAAAAADPGDYRLYFLAALCAPTPLADADLALLLKARALAPQVPEIGLSAALALQARGDTAAARRILAPIAADLHGGGMAEAAARMLATLPQ